MILAPLESRPSRGDRHAAARDKAVPTGRAARSGGEPQLPCALAPRAGFPSSLVVTGAGGLRAVSLNSAPDGAAMLTADASCASADFCRATLSTLTCDGLTGAA